MILNTTGIIWTVETNYFNTLSLAKDKVNKLSIGDNSKYGVFQSTVFVYYIVIGLKKFKTSPLLKTIYNNYNKINVGSSK